MDLLSTRLLEAVPAQVQTRQAHRTGVPFNTRPRDDAMMTSLIILCQEEDELIAEWQSEPLVPVDYPNDREIDPAPVVSR